MQDMCSRLSFSPPPSPESAFLLRALAPFLEERCLEAKMWELGVLIATVLSSLLDFPAVQSVATVPEMDISNKGTVSAVSYMCLPGRPCGNNWAWMFHLLPARSLSLCLCEVGPLNDHSVAVVDAG